METLRKSRRVERKARSERRTAEPTGTARRRANRPCSGALQDDRTPRSGARHTAGKQRAYSRGERLGRKAAAPQSTTAKGRSMGTPTGPGSPRQSGKPPTESTPAARPTSRAPAGRRKMIQGGPEQRHANDEPNQTCAPKGTGRRQNSTAEAVANRTRQSAASRPRRTRRRAGTRSPGPLNRPTGSSTRRATTPPAARQRLESEPPDEPREAPGDRPRQADGTRRPSGRRTVYRVGASIVERSRRRRSTPGRTTPRPHRDAEGRRR